MGNKRNAAITFDSELYNSRFDPTWNRHVLYSLAEWINGMAFRNINFTSNGKPVIKIAEIKNGISGQTKFTQADYDSIYRVTDGDMLFSWSGQPDTSIDVFRWRGPDGWLNQHIFKVHPKDRCLEAYFFYLLKYLNPNFVRIARNKQTTGLGHVTKRDLQNMKVGLPSEDDQRAIAHILGSLDDKIELNRQINRTLEAMSQAIFKSWFVDFEPVRAKAEGRDPGLPKDIADLFPDSFEDLELEKIPKGWKVSTIGNALELIYGKALKASNRRLGTVPVYGSNGRVGWHDEKLAQGPGIVIGRKGNPGIVTWVPTDFFPIDTTFYVAPKDSALSILFLFYALQGQNLPSLGADSAVPGLNRNMAYMNQWVIPPTKLVRAFDNKCFPLYDKIQEYNEESLTLTALRDTLLPKLLSGELRVPDYEKLMGDIA